MEKKVREYIENQYPYWVLNLKRTGAYFEFILKHSNPKNTPEENFTQVDQSFQLCDNGMEILN